MKYVFYPVFNSEERDVLISRATVCGLKVEQLIRHELGFPVDVDEASIARRGPKPLDPETLLKREKERTWVRDLMKYARAQKAPTSKRPSDKVRIRRFTAAEFLARVEAGRENLMDEAAFDRLEKAVSRSIVNSFWSPPKAEDLPPASKDVKNPGKKG